MTLQIKKLTSKGTSLARRTLIYGDPSAGKTMLSGTAQDVPEMRDILVADMDGGSITLRSRGDVSAVDTRNVTNVEQLLWMLIDKKPEVAGIGTLVLDGCSELQKRDLADIATAEAKKSSTREKPRDADRNELLDYRVNQTRMLRIFRMARDIPDINVIATCWAKKTFPKTPDGKQKKDSQPTMIVPDLTAGVMDTVLGAFDNVWYLFHDPETDQRHLITNNYNVVRAKTRDEGVAKLLCNKDGLPILTNPSFPVIYDAYKAVFSAPTTTKKGDK